MIIRRPAAFVVQDQFRSKTYDLSFVVLLVSSDVCAMGAKDKDKCKRSKIKDKSKK